LQDGDLVATSHLADIADGDTVSPQVQTVVALAR
jgi:hypothetical protein